MSGLKRLEFSAYCDTQYGEFVYICGNIPQLGNWNPLKGLRLYTQQSFYPIWKSFNSVLVIQNQPIQFKICIVTTKCEFKWQSLKQNRIILPEMDAYIKLKVNEYESYEILPFNQRDQPVRRGIDNVLNDLSSDCSSSISFKSNYRFYEYYRHNSEESDKIIQKKQKQINLNYSNSKRSNRSSQNYFVTFLDPNEILQQKKIQYTDPAQENVLNSRQTSEKQYSDNMTIQNEQTYQEDAEDILDQNDDKIVLIKSSVSQFSLI